MPITPTKKIWMDGTFVDWPDATVHVLSHTLHYGTGAFEGIRAYKTPNGVAIFRLKEHLERLLRSCKILMIDVPYSLADLCGATKEIVRVNELHDGCYIRPIVYLGYGEMGVNPIGSPVNTAIAAWPWGAYLGEEASLNGARMKISSWSRHHPNSMPTASKTIGGYVNASLAKVEAVKAGYDEALMLGPDGRVSEGTGENLFLVRDGTLVSPPPSEAGALQGITQASIVKIAKDLGYEVTFEALRRDDIYLADEAFVTGTAVEVVPLSSVDDRLIGDGKPGPITKNIKTTFHQAVSGERPQYEDWLTRV
ncbi:MAG TPA: branched-chain amino acid transaminase [Acidimicrobiales bacterium]|jgi:branched-chain amino acid aminotransferase|nr:branched-chain amino acid transaminase [Acidimicrobiales bacterium]